MLTLSPAPRQQHGFTIVELLIVIVVIGVLAAITIVAFNGTQARAENNKTINAVAAYARAITAFAAETSLYPVPTQNYPCLGNNVAYCANMTDTGSGCEGSGRAGVSSNLNNSLSALTTSLPDPSLQSLNCNGKQYAGAYYSYTNGGKGALIRYYLRGDVSCPNPAGLPNSLRYQNADTTVCSASFPLLP